MFVNLERCRTCQCCCWLEKIWATLKLACVVWQNLPRCPLLAGTLSAGQSMVGGSPCAVFPWPLLSPPFLPLSLSPTSTLSNLLPSFLLLDPAASLTLSFVPFPMLLTHFYFFALIVFCSYSKARDFLLVR